MSDDGKPPKHSARAHVAQLYAQYSEGLLAFFRAALPMSTNDAVDLLQQTFVELLQWFENGPKDGPERTIEYPRAFLFTIANRRLIAYRDKQRRTPDDPQAVEPELDARVGEDDDEYLATLRADQRGVLRAMRRLRDRDLQVVLYLRFWGGLSEEAVARVVDRTRPTVARQLRKARAQLKAELAELGRHEPDVARTSTTLLERWWHQVEAEAKGLGESSDDDDDER